MDIFPRKINKINDFNVKRILNTGVPYEVYW